MAEAVKVVHSGIEITYVEGRNVWLFELRGRERSAESLQAARTAIDKPEPKEKKPFTRISAYKFGYDGLKMVEITSIAEERGYGSAQVWISHNGNRSKESVSSLYDASPANQKLVEQWFQVKKEKDALEEKMRVLASKMKQIEID